MADDHDAFVARMTVGKMMADDWAADPPDPDVWVRALEGCAELFRHAARHLEADPPRYGEAARVIATAVRTAADVHAEVVVSHVLSGQAVDDVLHLVRTQLGEGASDG